MARSKAVQVDDDEATPPTLVLAGATLPGQDVVQHDLIDEAIRRMVDVKVRGTLAIAMKVGEIIVNVFFAGDIGRARDRSRTKHASLRALSDREDMPFSASYLSRAIGVYASAGQIPEDLVYELPLSHHQLLLPVKDPTVKQRLAREAVAAKMPKEEFAARIAELREPAARPGPDRKERDSAPELETDARDDVVDVPADHPLRERIAAVVAAVDQLGVGPRGPLLSSEARSDAADELQRCVRVLNTEIARLRAR